MKKVIALLVIGLLVAAGSLVAQGIPQLPMNEKELIEILKDKKRQANALPIIQQRGVAFELTPEIEKQLRKAKATEEVIAAVKKETPSARTERAKAQGYIIATAEEESDMRAIQDELNPDVAIQLAAEFVEKHPGSALLTYVHAFSASQYARKGDVDSLIAQCEKSLALKSDNLMSLLMLAQTLPQPQSLRKGNPDKLLDEAEKYAGQALVLIGNLTHQPEEAEDKFETRKNTYLRDLHSSLGMVHFQRSLQSLTGQPDSGELGKAETEFDLAVTISGEPNATDYYRLGEVRQYLHKTDAAIEAFSRAAELDDGLGIKGYAEERIAALQKEKGQPPARPQAKTQEPQATENTRAQVKRPLSQKELLDLLASEVPPARIEDLARESGISFELTPQTERELRAAGATEDLLVALHKLSPKR